MSLRKRLRHLSLHAVSCALILLLASTTAVAQPTPLSCIGSGNQAYGVQDTSADFYEIPGNLNFTSLCSPSSGEELNNLCYRSADGLFYAVELTSTGNNGIVTIDADCDVSSPLSLSGTTLPSNIRFDAGDCLPDGSKMFINVAGERDGFYVVDLDSLSVTKLSTSTMTWDTGAVNDWTYNPTDGKLYGGDRADGELAVVELSPDPYSPTSATRTDSTVSSGGLPSSMSASYAYGGAWFNTNLNRLFLHRNNGVVYEVDVSGPSLVATYTDTTPSPNIPSSDRNDSAPCHCDTAYFIQEEGADVYECDSSVPTLSCTKICDFTGALDAAHQAGVVHCDFKTGNVILVGGERRSGVPWSPTSASPRSPSSGTEPLREPARGSPRTARRRTWRRSSTPDRRPRPRPTSTPSAWCSTRCSPANCRSPVPLPGWPGCTRG